VPVEVVRRRAEHDDEIFRLYEEVFGAAGTEASRKRWSWQFVENPGTPADGPVIWMARDGDRLIGQMATMPFTVWWGGREVTGSAGMDYFVRKGEQGRGLGILLSETWAANVDIAFALGLTPSSYPLFKKIFRDVGPVPFFQKVLDPRVVARRRLGSFLGTLASPLLSLGLRVVLGREPEPPPDVTVHRITEFGADYDALWERARASYAMCIRRDAAYLNWKYLACPHRRYDVREARRAGQLVGFAVTREEDYRGVRLGWIVDLFAGADDHGARHALLADTLASFRAAGVARAQTYSMNAPLTADLRRFGFFSGRTALQFCIKWTPDPRGAFEQMERWNLVLGDGDLDR
jgi:hypothetical protein